MKLIRKITFLAFTFIIIMASGNPLAAQSKYGHMNYGNLLEQVPELKSGNTQLETYRDQLVKQGKARAAKWEKDVKDFQAKAQAGDMTGLQIKQAEEKLGKEQKSIAALEQEVIAKVSAKRDEILKPILEKVDVAVQAVGKENGYSMIFDSSIYNFILSAEDSDEVTSLVKKKLGL
jgi:outer membrane protein